MAMEQEGPHSDPAQEWDPQGQDTGLEGSMWRVGLEEPLPYPERPGEPDCFYYLRTGFCGYADRCHFNHPRDRPVTAVVASGRGTGGDYPERAGQPICQHYMRTGSCKFGTSCKYHHPRQGPSSVSQFALNVYGYPLRPGEKECTYYIKTGQCKFGMTCKFHHPPPTNVPVAAPTPAAMPPNPLAAPTVYSMPPPPAPQQYGVVAGNWPVARPSMVPGSYIPGPYGPMLLSPGVVPFPGWAPYPGSTPVTTPNTQSVGAGQFYGLMSLSPSAATYAGPYQALPSSGAPSNVSKEHSYPQRPGQPECQHYIKTGDCKFGSSCKYHHPTEWVVPESSSTLSPMGLPLRPGTPVCSYYAQHGVCKFGPSCKFDHPMGSLSYCPSASSLSDMPVAPYPVGSSIATLAPSSSSSDLRAEVTISGTNKDSSSILSTSVSISSGSGGSVLSKSGSISQSGLQQLSQSSATLSSVKGSEGHDGTPS